MSDDTSPAGLPAATPPAAAEDSAAPAEAAQPDAKTAVDTAADAPPKQRSSKSAGAGKEAAQGTATAPAKRKDAQKPPTPGQPSSPLQVPGSAAEIEEEIPIAGTSAPAPPAPAFSAPPPAGEVPVRQKLAPAPYWSDQAVEAAPDEEIPIASSPATSLYEAEIEVRQLSERSGGQNAAIGSMAAGALRLIGDNLRRMTEEQADRVTQMLHGIDLKDYLDPDFWKGIGMVLRYQADELVGFFKRRLSGQYSTDPYGMDRELIEAVRPLLQFMYRTWWRVTPEGLENVPAEGRGLLVANHSGVLPWDGAMIAAAVLEDHPAQSERILRSLHLNWFSTLPFVAPALAALGQVPGLPENAVHLLDTDELVCVFPEGLKGVGKLYKDRYKLARFGRGGFVQAAIRTQSPIVPVAVVGAEEIYPMLANAEPVARLLGMPYFPLTPFFPWLGPLGVIPLPTRWSITFCEPLRTDMYDPSEADDPLTVLGLTEMVRGTIQETIDARLALRNSVF